MQVRITPAGAGKTAVVTLARQSKWDHPRRCGENRDGPAGICLNIGSPPQVRGKQIVFAPAAGSGRITPAGAGKTGSMDARCKAPEDHPRRCGENPRRQADRVELPGSPPQVRGKLQGLKRTNMRYRITPAGAGKTKESSILCSIDKDHPRRCGENRHRADDFVPLEGSPPQVRGKRLCSQTPTVGNRITPAGAGKTPHSWLKTNYL